MRAIPGGLARATVPAMLVPAGMVAALVIVAVVGGGLRGLGQVLGGPEAPAIAGEARPTAPRSGAPRAAATVPAIPVPAAAAARRLAPAAARGAPRRRAAASPPQRSAPRRPATVVPRAPAPGGAGAPSPPSSSSPPSPVRQVGHQVAEAVRPAPVAGGPAADAIEHVVDEVDGAGRARVHVPALP